MDNNQYSSIVSVIKKYRGLSSNCLKRLLNEFPNCSYDTLYSILQCEYLKRMKMNHSKLHRSKQRIWDTYVKEVNSGKSSGIIIKIAESLDVAPCLVAKIILNRYFEEYSIKENAEQTSININVYLRDTGLISDPKLAYEVFLCTISDNIYSPLTDAMKNSLGQQYEIKLYREATELGLGFRDEDHLRKHGYDKTPDCKLEVPIAIGGFIVNWIESKALFGEADVHKDYVKNQYMSYWNRFGPGLVIYWFGYLETIVDSTEKRFIIRDHLPKDIVGMPDVNFE